MHAHSPILWSLFVFKMHQSSKKPQSLTKKCLERHKNGRIMPGKIKAWANWRVSDNVQKSEKVLIALGL